MKDVSAAVIDYEDGFLAKNTRGTGIALRVYDPRRQIVVGKGEVLVTPLSSLWMMKECVRLESGARVMFWNIHPSNALVNSPLHHQLARMYPEHAARVMAVVQPSLRNRICHLLESLHESGGLIEMDVEVHRANAILFGVAFTPKLIPIPVPIGPEARLREEDILGEDLSELGWLGRLSVDKVPSLLRTLADAESSAKKYGRHLRFHIIGDGTQARRIQKWASRSKHIKCVFVGTKTGGEVETYLRRNVQAVFAMGTSCLEAGRLALPSVLVDAAYWEVPARKFKYAWLHETKGYCLGRIWTPDRRPYPYDMDDLIKMLATREARKVIGHHCQEYVRERHSLEAVAESLVQAACACRCGHGTIDFADLLKLRGHDRTFEALKAAWVHLRRRWPSA